eukprot:TRINITY_DN2121_c0_g1_i5.p1 TRINITY_DN2121_c0_g1~~TRINITY_DN2121_c0_g1_i5.p1  ORF type:complete len:226 (+),score=24.75 TRINITY_DN2121_c0_g1_i5:150-827(+)
MLRSLVGSEMCIRDSINAEYGGPFWNLMDQPIVRIHRTGVACSLCGQPPTDRTQSGKCGGCLVAYYCCADHQRADWAVHKPECGRLSNRWWVRAKAGAWRGFRTGMSRLLTGDIARVAAAIQKQKLDGLETLRVDEQDPACTVCGQASAARCSRCRQAWYCSRECQVQDWPSHRSQCTMKCNHCGKQGAQKRCSRCKQAWYCGRECQETDWVAGHATTCYPHPQV